MKKDKTDDLRPEYQREDLGPGIRGKFYESYQKGTNLVLLSPDSPVPQEAVRKPSVSSAPIVAKAFPTEEAVNNALLLH